MPEGIPYVGTNVVAGTGPDLNYLGDHCFAYSGVINASGETNYLDFTSGGGYILADIQALTDQANGDDFNIKFYVNGIVVGTAHAFFYSNSTYVVGAAQWQLLIPPYTNIKITIENSGTADEWAVMLIGKVHK